MNLRTSYLGLDLPHPLMPGASPMVDDLGTVRRLEDAGAAAIVMHSLFEEQIVKDEWSTFRHQATHEESFAEALSYFPEPDDFALGPERYLEQIRKIKEAVDVPVIASLNGSRPGGWIEYARLIQDACADALELNIYFLATDAEETAETVDRRTLEVLEAVRAAVTLPLAVKLSPFYSSLPHLTMQLEALGANGLILFNRFFQPDIEPETLETVPRLELSTPAELRLRLRWLAILRDRTRCSLACSGGVHGVNDVIKALMAGADAVQCVSALLQNGPNHLRRLLEGLEQWLVEHEYESLEQLRGSMSLAHCPDPAAYERANYLKALQLWRT